MEEARAPLAFWILLQAIWAALIILFIGGDLFNLYVALELLTFAAVPLVCLSGKPETLAAALRYLMFALFGSVFYLLGAALLYGAYGTLDIVLLSERVTPLPAVWLAAGLMTAGLLAKTALFPAASVAAPGARQCARRRQRRAVRTGRQRLFLADRPAVVLCAAGAARAARRRLCSGRLARRRSCLAACWPCASPGSNCSSPIRRWRRSAICS